MKNILIIFVYFALLLSFRAEAQDLLSTYHLREQIELSGVEISPDGKQILMLVSRQNYDSNDFLTELVMIDADSKEQRTLSKRTDISTATWSPAGDRIAFLGTVDDVTQVFTLSLQGGEAQQITHSKGGILHYTWSPIIKTGTKRFNDSFEVGNMRFRMQTL